MNSVLGGARVTLISQWIRAALQILSFIILSRLLPPEDFGLIAMVAVVVGLAAIFADLGLSLAALQASTLTQEQKSNLFWVNSLAGLVGMALVAVSGPLLARFYGVQELVWIAPALAIVLLLNATAVQFRVEINRRRQFGILALQDVLSTAVGLVLAVTAALIGMGYWALVVQSVSQSVTALIFAVAQARWWPGAPSRAPGMKPLLTFGGDTLSVQLINYASRSVDAIAIGRVQGADALGYYGRATQLVNILFQQLITPLARVIVPALSVPRSAESFQLQVERLQRVVVYIMIGVLSAVVALADPLTTTFLGLNWSPMVLALQVLCVAAIFQALSYIYYWVALAKARTKVLLVSEAPGRIVMVALSITLAPYGIAAVAMAILAGQVLIWIMGSWFAARRLDLLVAKLVRVALVPLLMFGSISAVVLLTLHYTPVNDLAAMVRLAVGSVAWLSLTAVCVAIVPSARHVLREVALLLRKG